MAEALAQVKKDLGLDAVILQTRRIRRGGMFGFFGAEEVEVMAAIDPESRQKYSSQRAESISSLPANRDNYEMDSKLMAVHFEIANMKKTLEQAISNIQPEQQPSPHLSEWARKSDIDSTAADTLMKGLPAFSNKNIDSLEHYKKDLYERIYPYFQNVSPVQILPGQCKVVALIGPTGVGKTTTVAKLAANFALKEGYRVALITADTYRIAAVEQLKTYADLIGVPIEIVYTPSELRAALYKHKDKNLVLVDTAGRSPSNSLQMAELEEFLAVEPNIERHLLISLTTKCSDAIDIVKRFKGSNPEKYLFTKIDEACNLGTLFNLMYFAPSTLSYITTGQNVPDDIELADPIRLTNLMLRG